MKFANSRTVSASALALLVATALSACAVDTGDQPEDFVGDEVAGDEFPGDVTDKAGDSKVRWCDEPPSVGWKGTVCVQQGCSGDNCLFREPQAIAECRVEVSNICGGPVQPWYILRIWDNTWQRLY